MKKCSIWKRGHRHLTDEDGCVRNCRCGARYQASNSTSLFGLDPSRGITHTQRSRKALKTQAKSAKLTANHFEARCADLEQQVTCLRGACRAALNWFRFYVGPGDTDAVIEAMQAALGADEDEDEEVRHTYLDATDGD